jgi:hemolysin activation/secretion protein
MCSLAFPPTQKKGGDLKKDVQKVGYLKIRNIRASRFRGGPNSVTNLLTGLMVLLVLDRRMIVPGNTASGQTLPPVPATTQPMLSQADRFLVRRFTFSGATAFSNEKLDEIVRPWVGREITLDDLEEARRQVTLLYINAGYINSGAVIPDQDVSGGEVRIQVVEGKLTAVRVNDQTPGRLPRLRAGLVADRVRVGSGNPLNVGQLKDELELLRQNPNVKRVNAELRPEPTPGESSLDLAMEANNPFHLQFLFNNRRPPSVGSNKLELAASDTNLTGNADPLSVHYTILRGDFDSLEYAGTDEYSIDYSIPFTPVETSFFVAFSRTDNPVVEEQFRTLDIASRTTDVSFGLRQPIIRRPEQTLALTLGFAFRETDSSLLGQPFSFTSGAIDGVSKVSAIRLGQEYSVSSQTQAFSVRSTFSFGIDAFDATLHADPDLADSHFVSWLGQGQYVRRLGDKGWQLIARATAQFANEPLLSPEQIPVGGFDSVRGYRENTYVRDNAVFGTLELRVPVIEKSGQTIVDLATFADLGQAWDVHPQANTRRFEMIGSAGVGILAHPEEHVDFVIYYGYPFRDLGHHADLQDIGIHFELVLTAF